MPILLGPVEDLPFPERPQIWRFLDPKLPRSLIRNYTKVLCCKNCNLPFCTGLQIIDTVHTLEDYYLVQAIGSNITFALDNNGNTVLHSAVSKNETGERAVSLKTIICSGCNKFAGYGVTMVEPGPQDFVVEAGHYFVCGRLYEKVP